MITVPEAAERIVSRSRYLSEAISKKIINLSQLARYIRPEIEEMLSKKVSETSILMALHRLADRIKPKFVYPTIFTTPPDMIVRSNLIECTVANSETLIKKYEELLKLSNMQSKYFFTVTEGLFETTIIASKDLEKKIKQVLHNETIVVEFNNLSAITIRFPKKAIETPGIFYFFLKSLAWEGVNLIEIVSSHLEFTLILKSEDTNKAFSILQSLFLQKPIGA